MIANNLSILPLANGEVQVSYNVTITEEEANKLVMLSVNCDKIEAEIKKYREKRSRTANGYCWTLANKMAQELKSTKEEVYQEAIRKVGVFDYVAVPDKAVEAFIRHFNGQGIGNYAEETEKAKEEGYKVIRCYYGSSSYDTREMSILIDYMVEEAKAMGIETLTPDELAKLKAQIGE